VTKPFIPLPDNEAQLAPCLAELPSTPGVYFFYRGETPLYIGKSVDIRQRIRSHYYARKNDHREQRLFESADRLYYTQTPGELSALLMESREIKARHPLYNRRLRRARKLLCWQIGKTQKGSTEKPELTLRTHQWPPQDPSCEFGLYRNRRQANEAIKKLCQTHALCEQRLGIIQGTGPCFNYQIRKCRGVCAGIENPEDHDLRFEQAIRALRGPEWPFEGPVAIRETLDQTELAVLHRWHYLGTAASLEEAEQKVRRHNEKPAAEPATTLDLDSYRIVLSFILGNKGCLSLHPLNSADGTGTPATRMDGLRSV